MMADESATAKPKSAALKLPLAIGMVLALAGGGASFYAVHGDIVPLPFPSRAEMADRRARLAPLDLPETAFVALEPVIVTLGRGAEMRQLALTAQLEIEPNAIETVMLLAPRVADVINIYLRAVDVAAVEDPASMLRLRAQMLRRIQVVTGEGVVRDLLVSEFILR